MNCEQRRGVAEQTGILLGKNTAIHCQRVLAIKSQIEMEVWWKPISFVIHKVAMTSNEGYLHRIYPVSQRKSLSLGTQASVPFRDPRKGSSQKDLSWRVKCAAWLFCQWKLAGKSHSLWNARHHALSPTPFGRCFFFSFQCKSSLISPYKKIVLSFP